MTNTSTEPLIGACINSLARSAGISTISPLNTCVLTFDHGAVVRGDRARRAGWRPASSPESSNT
jgi:hypothetical protein